MMRQMKATQAFRYSGKMLAVGDPLEATPGHAKLLSLLNRADYTDGVEATGKRTTRKRQSRNTPKKDGGYQRRDLRAESQE